MRRTLGWLAGALGVAGAIKALKGGAQPVPAPVEPVPDPRADELRRRLEEAKSLEGEREEFEAGETPVDEADPDAKRRDVHDRARAAIDEMRGPDEPA